MNVDAAAGSNPDFSLVVGGPLHALLRRLGQALLAWFPPASLVAIQTL
jgi:hypothetical protein